MDIIVFIFQLLSVIFNFIKEPVHLLFALMGFVSGGMLSGLASIYFTVPRDLPFLEFLGIFAILAIFGGCVGMLGGVVGGRLGKVFGRKGQIITAVIGGGIAPLLMWYCFYAIA